MLVMVQPAYPVAPAQVDVTQRELQIFNMLRTDTMDQVTGVFDPGFWKVNVLQAAREYPAIWHAGLAFASMHRRMTVDEGDQRTRQYYYTFALEQYNRSIQWLVNAARPAEADQQRMLANQETMLLAGMIYTGISCLQGDTRQAVSHVSNVLGLFYQWQYWERSEEPQCTRAARAGNVVCARSLVALITNFEGQFLNRLHQVPRPLLRWGVTPQPCSSEPFTSVMEAYAEFLPLKNGLLESWRYFEHPADVVRPSLNMYQSYCVELRVWVSKFEDLLVRSREKYPDPCSDPDWEALAIMQQLRKGVETCFEVDTAASTLKFEKLQPRFVEVLHLLEELHENRRKYSKPRGTTPVVFSFSHSVAEIFFWVIANNRDRDLRTRALDLLRKWNEKDGIWDSTFMANILEAAIHEEERGPRKLQDMREQADIDGNDNNDAPGRCDCVLDGWICEGHRIYKTWVEFRDDSTADFYMLTPNDQRRCLAPRVVRLPY